MKRVVLILCCAALPATGFAQAPVDTSHDRAGAKATEVWAGYSARSPKWGVLGNRPGMSFAIAAGRVTRRVKTTPRYALDYAMDFVPLALSSPPIGSEPAEDTGMGSGLSSGVEQDCTLSVFGCRFPRGSAFGMGISPLGINAVYRRDRMLQPRLGAIGGLLFFDRRVPTIISTRFNFTAMLEAGFQVLNHNGDGVLVMYRFHHLSNAGTGYDNSALASHVISLGARFRSRGH